VQQEGPVFSFQLPYKISRIQPALNGNLVALQSVSEAGAVRLHSCDVKNQEITTSLELPVYYQLIGFTGKCMLVQAYEQLDKPHEPNLIIFTGDFKENFRLSSASVLEFTSTAVKVRQIENEVWHEYWLDLVRFKKLENFKGLSAEENKVYQPQLYPEGSEYFATVSNFVEQLSGEKIRYKAEYLPMFGKILISYYTEYGKLFHRHLMLLNESGKLLYKNTYEKKESPDGTTTFMVWNSYILTLPNPNTLEGYDLKSLGV
jgi:hypothetical protein